MFTSRAFIAIAFLFVFGCAKENQPPAQPVQVKLKGGGDCLSSFADNISKFRKGEMSDPEVNAFWTCVQKAVSDYQRLTAGDNGQGAYTPQAVRRFLQRYFMKSSTINDPLLMSIMEIKRVLLSGSPDSITDEELTKLQGLMNLLREISIELNPYVKIIFMDAEQATDQELRQAGEAAERAILRIGQWLSVHSQAYTFAQMSELARNLKEFSSTDGEAPELFNNLEKAIEVMPAAKKIILNGPRDHIHGSEWSRLTLALGQGYRSLLSVRYAFKEDLNSALVREAVPAGLGLVVQILERGALAHPKNKIPLTEWRDLFESLDKAGWLGEEFTPDNLMHALQWVLDRTLARGKQDPASALTVNHLKLLRSRLGEWHMLHKAVLGRGALVGQIAKHFERTLAATAPHEWDANGRMLFAQKPAKEWTPENKLRIVWPFVVMNWLKEAYSAPEVSELNDEQMTAAATEILEVLQKFGWLKDTQPSIGKKLLRESDLFTLASNGNGSIDVHEATRYLVFIASSYRGAQLWLDQARIVCGGQGAQCVREVGSDLSRDILSSMPRLQHWLKKDTLKRFTAYVKAGEETILDEVVEGEFSTGDLLQVWMIFQYVETFLQRFDRDFSESVSLTEATPAYELFGPTLANLLSGVGMPPDELFGFFTFMMKYGDTPFTMFGGQILYNHWKWHRNDWAFESDRTNLMGILNQLSKL